MSQPQFNNWQAIQGEVLRRIHARDWPPGHVIPNEVDLAREFGCARATVNRALQALADAGMLERRRKAGTRVALHPVSRATVEIPVIRQEIEGRGLAYGYTLISRDFVTVEGGDWLYLKALHRADDLPYVIEDRRINLDTIPDAANEDFSDVSANEWLLANAPYTHGEISFSAGAATGAEATLLDCAEGASLFRTDRTTWDHEKIITTVHLLYAPGYRINTRIGAVA